jgi:hypothetical protein
MHSERVASMEQDTKSNKVKSDLILWLLAAALAIVLSLVEKTPLWTGLLLAALVALLSHPVTQMPWIKIHIKRQVAALGFMVFLVACFGFAVWPKADKSATGAAYAASAAVALANIFLRLLREPKVQYGLCIVFGILLLAFFQHLAHRIAIIRKRNIGSRTGVKGFLDYKMQAENGIQMLSPKLDEISKIIGNVGCSIAKHTKRVQGASGSSARIQLKIVRKTANMLDGYSRQLDRKCGDLEEIGEPLAEGIEIWLTWVSKQPNGWAAKQELEGSLRPMAKIMEGTLDSTNAYLATLDAIRGVSRDMNDAVNRHLTSITRIRDTNEKIRRSCLEVLRIFDAIEPG